MSPVAPFDPGRPAHRDDARIVPNADDVAQTGKTDFRINLGFHIMLLLCYLGFLFSSFIRDVRNNWIRLASTPRDYNFHGKRHGTSKRHLRQAPER